jgi:hypothetical protein
MTVSASVCSYRCCGFVRRLSFVSSGVFQRAVSNDLILLYFSLLMKKKIVRSLNLKTKRLSCCIKQTGFHSAPCMNEKK